MTLLAVGPAGCSDAGSPPTARRGEPATAADRESSQVLLEARAAAYSRVENNYAFALYYKPVESSAAPALLPLCPLIVQQVEKDAPETWDAVRPARVGLDSSGQWVADIRRPTAYYRDSWINIHGADYRLLTFLWWAGPEAPESGRDRWRGFTMVLGRSGFPVLSRVVDTSTNVDIWFASEAMENRAITEVGAALAGRISSLEPAVEEDPSLVVARILSDGPVAMGPWVYLSDRDATVTTLLCRCMPSQVEDFGETNYYELASLSEFLDAARGSSGGPGSLVPPGVLSCIEPDLLARGLGRLRLPGELP